MGQQDETKQRLVSTLIKFKKESKSSNDCQWTLEFLRKLREEEPDYGTFARGRLENGNWLYFGVFFNMSAN